jgi:hypothetical protein
MITSCTGWPSLIDGHLVARLAVQVPHVVHALHGHDAHAVGARVGLHDAEGLLGDAVLRVLLADLVSTNSTFAARHSSPSFSAKFTLPHWLNAG